MKKPPWKAFGPKMGIRRKSRIGKRISKLRKQDGELSPTWGGATHSVAGQRKQKNNLGGDQEAKLTHRLQKSRFLLARAPSSKTIQSRK